MRIQISLAVLSYKDFRAAGHTEAEWDTYREQQNMLSRQRGFEKIVALWKAGGVDGNSIVNLFRAKHITIPEKIQKTLSHDDTVVSATNVEGLGLSKSEAAAIHKFVSLHIGHL